MDNVYRSNLVTDYIAVQRIISYSGAQNVEELLEETPRQINLENNRSCTLEKDGFVVLDFGMEYQGGIDITIKDVESGRGYLHIVFGESIEEAMSSIGEKNSTNDHAIRDMNVEVTSYSNFRVGQTGFRYVKIESMTSKIRICGIKCAFDHRDVKLKGYFESSDKKLNEIWEIGARTVFLNMQEYLFDGIKRDRLVWVGDMHTEVRTIMCTFGYNDVVKKSLDFVRDTTPPDKWMNTIASYNLWWLIIQWDWYLYTGDKKYIAENVEYIYKMVECILSKISTVGELSIKNSEDIDGQEMISKYFVDWETNGSACSKQGYFALLCMALNRVTKICVLFGNTELAKRCRSIICEIKAKNIQVPSNVQIASLMVLGGLADAHEVNNHLLNRKCEENISTFLGGYTLLARGLANDTIGALETIRNYWGRMIELGATSFWEAFDYKESFGACGINEIIPEGSRGIHGFGGKFCYKGLRHSLCHGWASGPTPFLSKYILGVTVLEPGCKTVRIKPDLADLKYIKGAYPTPFGDITIEGEKIKDKTQFKICAPEKIKVIRD